MRMVKRNGRVKQLRNVTRVNNYKIKVEPKKYNYTLQLQVLKQKKKSRKERKLKNKRKRMKNLGERTGLCKAEVDG